MYVHRLTICGTPCDENPPLLMETHYHLRKQFLKNKACLRIKTLFLKLTLIKFDKNLEFFSKKYQNFS